MHWRWNTRIAAQIIPGIGFIGAGSIIHAEGGLVSGLTTAATLFVVSSIGMAVGGGLYLTATFTTLLILLCLLLLGQMEQRLGLKLQECAYEVTGPSIDEVTAEVNRVTESVHAIMENKRSAPTKQHVRLQFELAARNKDHARILGALRASTVIESAISLGPVNPE
jgi:putative Mg2+ transporter-C (MgtC) family protein